MTYIDTVMMFLKAAGVHIMYNIHHSYSAVTQSLYKCTHCRDMLLTSVSTALTALHLVSNYKYYKTLQFRLFFHWLWYTILWKSNWFSLCWIDNQASKSIVYSLFRAVSVCSMHNINGNFMYTQCTHCTVQCLQAWIHWIHWSPVRHWPVCRLI